MSTVDPHVIVTLNRDSVCRMCGRPLLIGQQVNLGAFGFEHLFDCSGDHS
jgi:hypothetical protein